MKILIFIFLIIGIMVGITGEMIIPVYADTFQSYDNSNYLFLEINNDKVKGIMKIDGKITSINDMIKFYRNDNFKIRLFDGSVKLFGSTDSLKMTLVDKKENQKVFFDIQKLDTTSYEKKPVEKEFTPLEKFQHAQNQTGLGNIAEANRLEEQRLETIEEEKRLQEIANKTPRSEYQFIDDILELIVRSDFHVPLMTTFNFDLRAVDQNYNKYSQFFGVGFLEDVIVTGKVVDPQGKIWGTINDTTDEKGYYESQGLYIPYNTSTSGEWSLQLDGIKYFDDIEKFSTFNIVSPFFIVQNTDIKSSTCGVGLIRAVNGTCIMTP